MEDDRKGLRKRIKGVDSRRIVEKKGGLGSFLTVSLPGIIIIILSDYRIIRTRHSIYIGSLLPIRSQYPNHAHAPFHITSTTPI